ncbi:hypothetical protein GGR58DRAFT_474215 [Xylaria digitata]|nr:hypothetical protein GGR58DRAFT_474215 [Xylaria digitata]
MSTSGAYTIKSEGTNSQGNYYYVLDHGPDCPNKSAYNPYNAYCYYNKDQSTYFNDGRGTETYTTSTGARYVANDGSAWVREQ